MAVSVSTNRGGDGDGDDGRDEEEGMIYGFSKDQYTRASECNGSMCSVSGYKFGRCATKCSAIRNFNLGNVMEECHLVEQKYLSGKGGNCGESMPPRFQRNVAYWWVATCIYGVYGKGNRMQLPDCTVLYIRKKFSNTNSQGEIEHGGYVGFKCN